MMIRVTGWAGQLRLMKKPQAIIRAALVAAIVCLSMYMASLPSLHAVVRTTLDSFQTGLTYEQQLNRNRLGIVLLNTPPGYPTWQDISIKNKQQYAAKHGYGLYFQRELLDDKRPAVWSKIRAISNHIKAARHEWIWSLDMDTMITNHSKKVTDLLDDSFDLIASPDCNVILNAGSFLVRVSKWSQQFFEEVYMVRIATPTYWEENAAMLEVLQAMPDAMSHFKSLPQRDINAYHPGVCSSKPDGIWQLGDLLVHFPSVGKYSGFENLLLDYEKNKVVGL